MKCANFFLSILLSFAALCSYAQTNELNALADIVKSLQSGGEAAYKAAVATLATDKLWTPMDELGYDKTVECRVSDRVPGFRLNSVLTNAENANRFQSTTADHLNGADSRYSYSLFEKTLKANCTASFELPGRWGEQILLIIPYPGAKAKITAEATSAENDFSVSAFDNGGIKLTGKAVKGKALEITIKNNSAENVSYVIINYNSRI